MQRVSVIALAWLLFPLPAPAINFARISNTAERCLGLKVANPRGDSYLISDSLVKGLSCKTLSNDNVFTSLQPDAFSVEKQLPFPNWHSYGIANCWAIAGMQRQLFYLTRFNDTKASDPPRKSDLRRLLDLAGGAAPDRVFSVKDDDLRKLSAAMQGGTNDTTLSHQIELRQSTKFYNLDNLGMLFDSRERGKTETRNALAQIIHDRNRGRMPLLILRPTRTSQHVVLVKGMKQLGPDHFIMILYDSNQPFSEPRMEFRDGHFYAPEVVGLYDDDGNAPVGVFVNDQREMDQIQAVAAAHYAKTCRIVSALEKVVGQ
ncbi:MAG TPA: hypothetical protein VIH99_09175 [Bdellovibrionota bacterium]|jgi:hypothetical protein